MDFSSIVNNNASYWIIFLYGIMTSFHCISMCGGFILGGSIKNGKDNEKNNIYPMLLYNGGRIISYTLFGAIAGGVGSVIALNGVLKGILPLISGIIMIIMGLNFLGVLKKFKINLSFKKVEKINLFDDKKTNMFLIGLGTALLPCGPMQAIQFYALASGSIVKGSLAMLIFALGTVPVLFFFGIFTNKLTAKFSKIFLRVSAVILIVMGISMIGRGLTLFGLNIDVSKIWNENDKTVTATVNNDEQVLFTKFNGDKFEHVAFKKGVKVKWIINVDKKYVGQCFASLSIPEYNIKLELKEGDNIITFTPTESKEITYTSICGMLSNKITIYD